MSMTEFRRAELENGLEVSFSDRSNRYFGDYHRLCVVATLSYPIARLADGELRQQAATVFGERFTVTKCLERMGVPGAELEQARTVMVTDFLRHAAGYLGHADFPRRLVAAELRKLRSGRFHV
jgi:hypothetical protein